MDLITDAVAFVRKLGGKKQASGVTVKIKNSNNNGVYISMVSSTPASSSSVPTPVTCSPDKGNHHCSCVTTSSEVTAEKSSVTEPQITDSLPTPESSKPKRSIIDRLKRLRLRKQTSNVPSEPVQSEPTPSEPVLSGPVPFQPVPCGPVPFKLVPSKLVPSTSSVPARICSCDQSCHPQILAPEATPSRTQHKTSSISTHETSRHPLEVRPGLIVSPDVTEGMRTLNINQTPSNRLDIPPSTITSTNEQRFVVQARSFEHNRHMYTASVILSIIDWIPSNLDTLRQIEHRLKLRALDAGSDSHRGPLWVIRAHYEQSVSLGYYNVCANKAYAAWNGSDYNVTDFEVLCVHYGKVEWKDTRDNLIPENAVKGGITADGEKLYVGRAWHNGLVIPGRVQPSHHCIYITHEDTEYSFHNYQILCVIM